MNNKKQAPKLIEFCFVKYNGEIEVKYTREEGTEPCNKLLAEFKEVQEQAKLNGHDGCPYFTRYSDTKRNVWLEEAILDHLKTHTNKDSVDIVSHFGIRADIIMESLHNLEALDIIERENYSGVKHRYIIKKAAF